MPTFVEKSVLYLDCTVLFSTMRFKFPSHKVELHSTCSSIETRLSILQQTAGTDSRSALAYAVSTRWSFSDGREYTTVSVVFPWPAKVSTSVRFRWNAAIGLQRTKQLIVCAVLRMFPQW